MSCVLTLCAAYRPVHPSCQFWNMDRLIDGISSRETMISTLGRASNWTQANPHTSFGLYIAKASGDHLWRTFIRCKWMKLCEAETDSPGDVLGWKIRQMARVFCMQLHLLVTQYMESCLSIHAMYVVELLHTQSCSKMVRS